MDAVIHYLSLAEFAERAGLSVNTVKGYVRKNIAPAPDATVGTHRGWRPETVDRWITLRRIRTGATGHPNRRQRPRRALPPGTHTSPAEERDGSDSLSSR